MSKRIHLLLIVACLLFSCSSKPAITDVPTPKIITVEPTLTTEIPTKTPIAPTDEPTKTVVIETATPRVEEMILNRFGGEIKDSIKQYASVQDLDIEAIWNEINQNYEKSFKSLNYLNNEKLYFIVHDGYPLYRISNKDGIWMGEIVTFRTFFDLEGKFIGVNANGEEEKTLVKLNRVPFEHFNLLVTGGQASPWNVFVNGWSGGAARIRDLSSKNDATFMLQFIFEAEKMYEDSRTKNVVQDADNWAKRRITESLDYLFGKNGNLSLLKRPVLVVLFNETFLYDHWNKGDNPLYTRWGKDWWSKYYAEFVVQAAQRGLKPGVDYLIVDNENFTNRNKYIDLEVAKYVRDELFVQKQKAIDEINNRSIEVREENRHLLPTTINEIQLIIGMQLHTTADEMPVLYLHNVLTKEQLAEFIQTFSGEKYIGPLIFSELQVRIFNPEQKEIQKNYYSLILDYALNNENVLGVWFWGNFLGTDAEDRYGDTGLFDNKKSWEPTPLYYELLREMYNGWEK